MNEREKLFRSKIAPVLKDLAGLCRLNKTAFITIVEVEPGKMVQISYLPEKSALKQSLTTELDVIVNNEHFTAKLLNEENANIAKSIRAERG